MRFVSANVKSTSKSFNPLVVALVHEGVSTFEFACVAEIFGRPRPDFDQVAYRFETAALDARAPLRASLGLKILPDHDLRRLSDAGTIVIAGWKDDPAEPVPQPVISALRAAHQRGARLVSICTGAFVLAAAGLLDGKRATTHWRYAPLMQQMYPRVQVDADVLYIDEGNVLTSAGSAAAIDVCLHVVRTDYGAQVANHIARRLVVSPHRDGGQSQFIERPVPKRENGRLAHVLEHMQRDLARNLPVPELARMAAMSERTFMRKFRDATGVTPGDWLRLARLDRARQLLESSPVSVETVAQECGFGTATTLRQQFRKKMGLSPSAYKHRFAKAANG